MDIRGLIVLLILLLILIVIFVQSKKKWQVEIITTKGQTITSKKLISQKSCENKIEWYRLELWEKWLKKEGKWIGEGHTDPPPEEKEEIQYAYIITPKGEKIEVRVYGEDEKDNE